jgi:hypothetical protein
MISLADAAKMVVYEVRIQQLERELHLLGASPVTLEDARIYRAIRNLLNADEGATLELTGQNPHPGPGSPLECVSYNGSHTSWHRLECRGDTMEDCVKQIAHDHDKWLKNLREKTR